MAANRASIWSIGTSVVVLLLALFVLVPIDWALRQQHKHIPDPEALVSVNGAKMSAWDAWRVHLVPHLYPTGTGSPLNRWLLLRDPTHLWIGFCVLLGWIGWCGSLWLREVLPQRETLSWPAALASWLLSGLAGVIALALVSAFPEWIGWRIRHVLPLLAGLFLTLFFEKTKAILEATMDRLIRIVRGRRPSQTALAILLISAPAATRAEEPRSYYSCQSPAPPSPCWAFSEQDKKKCPGCLDWIEVYADAALQQIQAALSRPDKSAPEAALDQFSTAAWGKPSPRDTSSHKLLPLGDLYPNPQGFGMEVLELSEIRPGTLVLYPDSAGIIVRLKGSGRFGVVHASGTGGAGLSVETDLTGPGRPVFVIPKKPGAHSGPPPLAPNSVIVEGQPPAPAPMSAPASAAAAPASAPAAELPTTASAWPTVGLIGVALLLAGLAVGFCSQRSHK